MEKKFKVGDLVRHKSGGPLMVVYYAGTVTPGNQQSIEGYQCSWMDEYMSARRSECFHEEELSAVNQESNICKEVQSGILTPKDCCLRPKKYG